MEYKVTGHPQINQVIQLFNNEENPFRKVHRMIDLFESIIKTHTSYFIGTYFQNGNISEGIMGLFLEGLKTPSLGTWQLFSRTIFDELTLNNLDEVTFQKALELCQQQQKEKITKLYQQRNNQYVLIPYTKRKGITSRWRSSLIDIFSRLNTQNGIYQELFITEDFFDYFLEWDKDVDDVTKLRNTYAHGATPDDSSCQADIDEFSPILTKWLEAKWLNETTIMAFSETGQMLVLEEEGYLEDGGKKFIGQHDYEPGVAYLIKENKALVKLFPIQFLKSTTTHTYRLFFFNDMKKYNQSKISYLHYPSAVHSFEENIVERFLNVINIEKWREHDSQEFTAILSDLTETFKGRRVEGKRINRFIESSNKGFLYIIGNPGVGKSALIANQKIESNTKVIKYFIKRGTKYNSSSYFLTYLNNMIEQLTHKTEPSVETVEGKKEQLHRRLTQIKKDLKGQKLLICIDGIDEGLNTSNLITQAYPNVLVIYSGRSTKETDQLLLDLPSEHTLEMNLNGLFEEDIRSLLYEVVSKYSITEHHVKRILEQSNGNPLYLKLLCEEIASGARSLDDLDTLPAKIEGFYNKIMARYREEAIGDELLRSLYTFGAAQDYLSSSHLEQILSIGPALAEKVISSLQEVLVESSEKPRHYQLFHASLRDYFFKFFISKIEQAEWEILSFCRRWDELKPLSKEIALYPLKYFSVHLKNCQSHEELRALSMNDHFIQTQINGTGEYSHSFNLIEQSMKTIKAESSLVNSLLAVQVAKLHIRLSNSVDEIVMLAKSYDKASITQIIERIQMYKSEEKIIIYLLALYTILKTSNHSIKKEKTRAILSNFDEKVLNDFNIMNLNNIVPLILLTEIMVQLSKFGENVEPILNRIKINHDFHIKSEMDYLLSTDKKMDEYHLDIVRKLIGKITNTKVQGTLYEKLVNCYLINGYNQQALKTVDLLADEKKANGYLAILKYCPNEVTEQKIINEIIRLTRENGESKIFTTANSLLKLSKLTAAEALIKLLKNPYYQAVTYYQLSLAYENLLDMERATYYLNASNHALNKELLSIRNAEIDEQDDLYYQTVTNLFTNGLRKPAFQVINHIQQYVYKVLCLVEMFDSLYECEEIDAASELLEEAILNVDKCENEQKELAISFVVQRLGKLNRYQEAFSLAIQISKDNEVTVRDEHLQELAIDAFDDGEETLAFTILDEIEDQNLHIDSWTEINILLIEQKRIEEFLANLNKIRFEMKWEFIVNLSSALAKIDEIKMALYIAESKLNNLDLDCFYDRFVLFLCKIGKPEEAIKIINEKEITTTNFEHIILTFSSLGNHERAIEIVESLGKEYHSLIKRIVKDLCKDGKLISAFKLLLNNSKLSDKLPDESIHEEVFANLAIALWKLGKFEEGTNMLEKVQEIDIKDTALHEIGKFLLKNGRENAGQSIVQQISLIDKQDEVYDQMITYYAERSEFIEGYKYLDLLSSVGKKAKALRNLSGHILYENRDPLTKTLMNEKVVDFYTKTRSELIEKAKTGIINDFDEYIIVFARLSMWDSVNALLKSKYVRDRKKLMNELKSEEFIMTRDEKILEELDHESKSKIYESTILEYINMGLLDIALKNILQYKDYLNSKFDMLYSKIATTALRKRDRYIIIKVLVYSGYNASEYKSTSFLCFLATQAENQEELIFLIPIADMYLKSDFMEFQFYHSLINNFSRINVSVLLFLLPRMMRNRRLIGLFLYAFARYIHYLFDVPHDDKNKIDLLNTLNGVIDLSEVMNEYSNINLGRNSYETMSQWITNINDEDIIEQIKLWARFVQKGRKTVEEFDEEVEALLSKGIN